MDGFVKQAGVVIQGLGIGNWIQLISSVTAICAFIGLIVQIRVQNFQNKASRRPHFSVTFVNWVKAGDSAVSVAKSWDFNKYYVSMAAVKTIDDVNAIDLFIVATYEGGRKEYLYLTKLGKSKMLLDFEGGSEFDALDILFKTSLEEYGKATFTFKRFIVLIPEYHWGRKVKKEYESVAESTNNAREQAKTNFSTYIFSKNDMKMSRYHNQLMLKKSVVRDRKTDAINEYLYGDKDGSPKRKGKG